MYAPNGFDESPNSLESTRKKHAQAGQLQLQGAPTHSADLLVVNKAGAGRGAGAEGVRAEEAGRHGGGGGGGIEIELGYDEAHQKDALYRAGNKTWEDLNLCEGLMRGPCASLLHSNVGPQPLVGSHKQEKLARGRCVSKLLELHWSIHTKKSQSSDSWRGAEADIALRGHPKAACRHLRRADV